MGGSMRSKNKQTSISDASPLNKDFNDDLDRILKVTAAVFLVSPLITYLLVTLIYQLVVQTSGYNFVQGDRNTWIGFAGSIIGGSMTMLALLFTIRHEQKKQKIQRFEDDLRLKEDKASLYLPIFEVNRITYFNGKFRLELESITDKPIRDFKLVSQSFGDNSLAKNLLTLDIVPLLANTGTSYVSCEIDFNDISRKHDPLHVISILEFSYSDVLMLKCYSHRIEFGMSIRKSTTPGEFTFDNIYNIKNFPITESHFNQ